MALDDNYITLEELQAYIKVDESRGFDVQLQEAIDSSTEEINRCCHRNFNDAGDVSSRIYFPFTHPEYGPTILTDDFSTTEGLIVACGDTTFDVSSLLVTPVNGLMQGEPWPYTAIHGPFTGRVSVTARWGWASVPKPVKQAAYFIAQDTFQMKDQRLGIAGSDQFGQVITIKDNRPAKMKLKKYIKDAILVDG